MHICHPNQIADNWKQAKTATGSEFYNLLPAVPKSGPSLRYITLYASTIRRSALFARDLFRKISKY